jgi:MscS family membrane protein
VFGFLSAAQKKDYDVAAEYLDTRAHGAAATNLAQQLSVVLDQRLPARLNELSDTPEGSGWDPLNSNRDLVGTITSDNGDVQILLERVSRGKAGPVWLFSSKTLDAIPDLYQEVEAVNVDAALPGFLVTTRILGIQLFEWVAIFLGLPGLYLLTGLLNRLCGSIFGQLRRGLGNGSETKNPEILHKPTRLLLIALVITWLRPKVGLSLLARQFWGSTATVISVTAIVWILILLSSRVEHYASRRLRQRNLSGTASVLRLMRGVVDLLLVFAGALVILHYFGVNPTAALAGLGVGGIAVALAAQKTLENVIGGVSLIFDQVVRVGDTLKVGDIFGTVDEIGLRSTRIRTLDRTVVSVPNGQMATMTLETFSARDKFWFHPAIGLRYETTSAQMTGVVNGIRTLLLEHHFVERSSVRTRFLAVSCSSLDVDVFAYVYARDWNAFLEIQEGLLISIMEIIQEAGTQLAVPSRTVYVEKRAPSNFNRSAGEFRAEREALDQNAIRKSA